MYPKKWLSIFFIVTTLLLLSIGVWNYVVDPYGFNNVVKVKKFNFYKKSNTGYPYRLKTNMVKKGTFETLLIGTSRMGVMNPNVVNKMLNTQTFNFSAPGSITEIQAEVFFYTLKNQKIKNVIYGIDFLSFNANIKLEEKFKDFATSIQKSMRNNEEVYNFDFYFSFDALVESMNVVKKNFAGSDELSRHYNANNGMLEYSNFIQELEEEGQFDYDTHIRDNLKGYYAYQRKGGLQKYQFSYEYLKYFRKVVVYCKTHDINLWVYIPPMYKNQFDALYGYGIYKEFEQFKRELIQITDYVDFTGHNSITNKKENFWDGSHLKQEHTVLIMARILGKKSASLPDDFGRKVTKQNIEEHLKYLADGIEFFDINKSLSMASE
jgi:hypothetical protein